MKLATITTSTGYRAVRVDAERVVETGHTNIGELLANDNWEELAANASGTATPLAEVTFAALIPKPGKVICVGLNYRNHILEMGRELPEFPTLFAKYPEALIDPGAAIELGGQSTAWDWEAELAIIIGKRVRHATAAEAAAAIAGFSVINDITARDYQNRTLQWLQGKTWENTAPFGPTMTTVDELDELGGVRPSMRMTCSVNGEIMQDTNTGDLVFDAIALVEYISTILTLNPGDVIASGTPGGVGHARKPPRYLHDGDVVVTEIEGLGRLENVCRAV
jgi:acylpyruvate hydrolase